MKNVRINLAGAVAILVGILIPVVGLFISLWQNHPDPSAFRPRELGGLMLTVRKGQNIMLVDGEKVDAGSLEYTDRGEPVIPYPHETVEIIEDAGRIELPVTGVAALGGLVLCCGIIVTAVKKTG